ncbi:TMEM175 family protein [Glaciibacter sp. 2TAF33]|uniref:TMEM175 family protein n=1 Tax=Glaciibacter sp. 2TAF33 TaxID=3233015 RepID=UPI003F91937A
MPTTRGLERLIFFTDAVVAIAITLLILPLVDAASNASDSDSGAGAFLTSHNGQIFAFLISFAVIARLWVAHHRLFEHIAAYNRRVVWCSLAWAFTIVVLPLPTAMTAQFDPGPVTISFYIGTMLTSSALLTLLTLMVSGNPALQAVDNPIARNVLLSSVSTTGLFVLALLIGVLIPVVNYFALFLLAFSGPAKRVLERTRFGR